VDVGLAKIRDGTFGRCEICQSNIPIKRLNVVPYARYCLKCKEKIEAEKKA
jgi:DnaK suppressor protein